MAYEIIDELSRADIGFRVRGRDVVELFTAGANALISIMLNNPGAISKNIDIHFSCAAPDLELLYYDFLSEFIYYKDSDRLLLLPESLEIDLSGENRRLSCHARGEVIDRSRHRFSVDIKAATMHNLSIVQDDSGYQATIIVDV